uniref:uncharacterized protein isoform X2 n=1 Tax=Pristiophorus japonicus TaxID=55135 RepID=UPI00398ECD29
MDEVWLVSLCLTVLALVIAVFSLKKSDDKSESSAKGKKERSSEPVYSSSPQPTARCMELTLEDIEKSLERLGAVLGTEPPTATAKGTAPWRHAPDSDTQASLLGPEEQQQYRRVGRVSEPQGWAEDSDNDTWSHAERQDRVVAVKALPLPKPELVKQLLATEDWEFEDEEEIGALQCEGADKQYYQLYWDEESLPDRSNKSVVERADLNRRKQTYSMDTRERDRSCSAVLQLDSNPLYLQDSGKHHMSDQFGTTLVRFQRNEQIDNDKLESCTVKQISSTPQLLTNELSMSFQSVSGDKGSETDTELNLSLCTDGQKHHENENQISSWTGRDTDGDGSLCFEEFSLLRYKLQIKHRGSDSESSSMDSCLSPSPTLNKWSSVACLSQGDDASSIEDVSSSPANSKDSRFTPYDESSGSDISLLSFLSDSNLSESSSKNADSRNSKNSTLVARMRTGLGNTIAKTDKTLWPTLASEPSVAKLDTSNEVVVVGDLQNYFTKTNRNTHVLSGRKSEICSCALSSERELPTCLCTLQSAAFYSGEPNTTEELPNVENVGYQMNTEDSGEPVKWRLEKRYKRKQVKNDVSALHNFSHCEDPHKWQDGTLRKTKSPQQLWPEFEQVKIEPSEQVDPRRHGGGEGREVLEHPPATSATQNIMDQIEQAVQETLDHNRERSEFIRVRRAPPAPRLETPPRDDVLQPRSLQSSD